MNKRGWKRNVVLVWVTCLVTMFVFAILILPKILLSGVSMSTTQACATYTVLPVSCSSVTGDETTPWRVNVQMTEPLDPNLEGTLTALRASVHGAYIDLRHNQPGFPYAKGQLIQVQITGTSMGEMPANTQVVVDSIYALPSGSTTLCRSLPLTCT